MANVKHTPGPWMICAERPNEIQLDDRDGEAVFPLIATVEMDNTDTGQGLADAVLIAAAPDLLAALKEIVTICTESAGDCRKRMGTRVGNTLVAAQEAIAKAEAL